MNSLKSFDLLESILFIENEDNVRNDLSKTLNSFCKKLYLAIDGEDGFSQHELYKPDLIISDIRMPKLDGIKMCTKIREKIKKLQ